MTSIASILDLLACPSCRGPLVSADAPTCQKCGARYDATGPVPNLQVPNLQVPNQANQANQRIANDPVSEVVRAFYSVSPFPGYPPRETLGSLRARAEKSEFARRLDDAIPLDADVAEIGCGTGQMSLYLASRGRRRVVGLDLTRASLLLAAEAGQRFGLERAAFVEGTLLEPPLARGAFDVVVCSGVLHHTRDPRRSFSAILPLVRPGGYVVIGLYNAIARIPHRIRRGFARLSGYRVFPFDPVLRARTGEPARRDAWLRDQYLHPEEHRHTVGEVKGWFADHRVTYVRSVPTTMLATSDGDPLFQKAEDDWGFENVLAQVTWAARLAHEGGLFVMIGRVSDGPAAITA